MSAIKRLWQWLPIGSHRIGRWHWLLLCFAVIWLAGALASQFVGPLKNAALPPKSTTQEDISVQPSTFSGIQDSSGFAPLEPDWPGLLADLGLKLLLTLGLLYVFLYLLRKFMTHRTESGHAPGIVVMQTVHLGQNRALHLIKVADRMVLLGATPSQISLLLEIDRPSPATDTTPQDSATRSFVEELLAQTKIS